MDTHQLLLDRIRYVQETGQPLRPAYSELKTYLLWHTVALGLLALIDLAAAGWIIWRQTRGG